MFHRFERRSYFILCILAVFFLVGAITLYTSALMFSYKRWVIVGPSLLPQNTPVVVFGGGMDDPTRMSQGQLDRAFTAASLYRDGYISKIILTGDDGAGKMDEISSMRSFMDTAHVRTYDLMVDDHSYRTYDSCWRLRYLFGVTKAVAISQSFHLPRILYLCRSMGIEMYGYSADRREYGGIWGPFLREMLARNKAWLDINFFHPRPRVATE